MTEQYYISSHVNTARLAVKSIVYDYNTSISSRLTQLSTIYHELYRRGEWIAYVLTSNYHPNYLGMKQVELVKANLGINDMKDTVAAEYGYHDWSLVKQLDDNLDPLFESTIDAITYGNIDQVRSNLIIKPSLITQQSQFGHGASLLHYIAANGVELYRQSIAYNAVEIATILIDAGANKKAEMNVYGGKFSAIDLLLSSAHPQEAGLVEGLSEILAH